MRGFGFVFCCKTGAMRKWYQKAGDVKRWADNDKPVDDDNVQKRKIACISKRQKMHNVWGNGWHNSCSTQQPVRARQGARHQGA